MAKKTSGEVSIKAGSNKITLRLTISAMQHIEDHFDMSIIKYMEQYAGKKMEMPRLSDMGIIYAAMTGRDVGDQTQLDAAGVELLSLIGFEVGVTAIMECMQNTLMPDIGNQSGNSQAASPRRKKTKPPKS